jgi:enamine deaminase RidA (YjgF/YER057c/UK114 family)
MDYVLGRRKEGSIMPWVKNEVGIEFFNPGDYFSTAAHLMVGHSYVLSGIIPANLDTRSGLSDQVMSVFGVLARRLEELNLKPANIYRITVFVAVSIEGFYEAFNKQYAELLHAAGVTVMPCRTMVEVAGLPKGAHVEFQVDALEPL